MTPNGAGAVQELVESPDWYTKLTDRQLCAYVRYQFVRLYERETDWDAPVHNRTKPYWDGGQDRYGVNHSSVWSRIVRVVRETRADPGAYVCAHFSGLVYVDQAARTNTIPDTRPANLASSLSVGIYSRYTAQFPKLVMKAFDIAGSTIANRMRGTENLELNVDDRLYYVLCDECYVSASPFFRNAFAARMGCDRAVERYLWHAAIDYEAQQRLYDVALRREPWCITEPLIAAVKEIRRHWMEYAG